MVQILFTIFGMGTKCLHYTQSHYIYTLYCTRGRIVAIRNIDMFDNKLYKAQCRYQCQRNYYNQEINNLVFNKKKVCYAATRGQLLLH